MKLERIVDGVVFVCITSGLVGTVLACAGALIVLHG